MENNIDQRSKIWLTDTFDEQTRLSVQKLMNRGGADYIDSFYKDLEFGTGGMRGVMGVGTNRINKYTIGRVTQGLSNYLKIKYAGKYIKVAIAYDCRHNSYEYSNYAARVFAANEISVFIFESLRPTPELSFAIRYLVCNAGIVLTASHNPPEYNGYKVYWSDGAQVVPPNDIGILEAIKKVGFDQIKFSGNENLINFIGEEVDREFIKACVLHGSYSKKGKNNFKIVFTSLHGTAIKSIPRALEEAGFDKVRIVEEQKEPNGDFPTVLSPNPEDPKALQMAMDIAKKENCDMVIGTDPDADRFGIAVKNFEGELEILSGNKTNAVLLDYLLEIKLKEKKNVNNLMIGTTIVSSQIIEDIGKYYGVECKSVLTGFKWIGKMIRDFEGQKEFVGGGEESFGFMVGDFVRDKDSVTSTLLAAEIGAITKAEGSSFFDRLIQIYLRTKLYEEGLFSIVKKGKKGKEKIDKIMMNLRNNPPNSFCFSPLIIIEDYLKSEKLDILSDRVIPLSLPKSNVLIFTTKNGDRIAVRPSGTEPKIKFYVSANQKLNSKEDYQKLKIELKNRIYTIEKELLNISF